ncbi:MAG: Rrf2 family transcriptional regulator [Verrucomicrobiota bacterium]|nr:Rrf2 family transcriptional regulator [Verrucomicrobiota bacterium]MEC7857175.1 Rrf2 family transcriptional regulator [Verrucomicrobiota bacterium]
MNISKKAEYAIRAVISIARHTTNSPLQISEISNNESIPIKFLEQILLSLKNNGILNSKRGANGGYLLAKSKDDISIGMILDIIDGPFDPIGVDSGNNLSAGLEKCFGQMIEIVNAHLNHFTIKDILEIEEPKDLFSFEI